MTRFGRLILGLGGMVFVQHNSWPSWRMVLASEPESKMGDENESSSVTKLDSKDFESEVKKAEGAVVGVFTSWCGNCTLFKPKYQAAARMMSDLRPGIKFFEINGDESSELLSKYSIKGYPTVLFFRKSTAPQDAEHYEGVRSPEALVQWAQAQMIPSITVFDSVKELEEYTASLDMNAEKQPRLFLTAYVVDQGSPKAQLVQSISKELRKHNIGQPYAGNEWMTLMVVGIDKKHTRVELRRTGQVKFRSEFDNKKETYAGDSKGNWTRGGIRKIIDEMMHWELLDHIPTAEMSKNEDATFIIIIPDSASDLQKQIDTFQSIAKSSVLAGGRYAVADLPSQEEFLRSQGVVPIAGVLVNKIVKVPGGHNPTVKKYYKSMPLSKENIEEFLHAIKMNQIPVHFKSEKEETSTGNVKHLTANQYLQIVGDEKRAVIVLQHKKSCAYCKEFLSEWKLMANRWTKKQKLMDLILMAEIDVSKNDVPDGAPPTVPHIVGYPIGPDSLKRKKTFDGERSPENLMAFLSDLLDTADSDEL